MIIRLLLTAGLAGGFLAEASSAMAQSMPSGPAMNAAGRAPQAGTPPASLEPGDGRVVGTGRAKGGAMPSRPVSPQPFSDRPARRKHPVNISRDNG
ncbi:MULTISPECIES: hypothetical protein [Microvirga]|uniref:hypothetical protein n=1 Tax=Microvirga TaxID=186650 RepID=UPI0021C7E72F|nr:MULTISPECIES: hypothetical protein [unclassified Microvirga]